jgi:nucleotide-binding universal stress UspA family protein
MSADAPAVRELRLIVGFDGSPGHAGARYRVPPAVGSAIHRMVGAVAVNLARHSPVPVTIVP